MGGGGGGFQRAGGQQFRTYGGGGMGAEIDPQDLFNMFFGGGGFGGPSATFTFGGPGMQGARVHRAGGRPQAGRGRAQPAAQETNALLQLLPLLILGLFSLLAYLPNIFATPDPSYTWSPSGKHRAQRFTPRHGVAYYVDTTAWEQHPWVVEAARTGPANAPSSLRKFEDRVENNWKNVLYNSCEQSREHQQRRILNTRGFLGMGVSSASEALRLKARLADNLLPLTGTTRSRAQDPSGKVRGLRASQGLWHSHVTAHTSSSARPH